MIKVGFLEENRQEKNNLIYTITGENSNFQGEKVMENSLEKGNSNQKIEIFKSGIFKFSALKWTFSS